MELARWSVDVNGHGKVELKGKVAYGESYSLTHDDLCPCRYLHEFSANRAESGGLEPHSER